MTRDLLIVGGGIFGLACGWCGVRSGLSVTIADGGAPGASLGLVGALSPHVPERWNAKKAFQLQALLGAGPFWAEVEAASGLSSGFGRPGRFIPIPSAKARDLAIRRGEEARTLWPDPFRWEVVETAQAGGWVADGAAPFGLVHETLSARLNPARACAALRGALLARGVEFRDGWQAEAVQPGSVRFAQGALDARNVIVAAGTGTAALLPGLGVRGVKGQAALLDGPGPEALIYGDGIYVLPHADGTVAVGSTSEDRFTGTQPDALLDDLLARARTLCPPLEGAQVLERWAGLRPRGPRPDPLAGPLAPGLWVATGGFKIGFGIAHEIAASLIAEVMGGPSSLPDLFRP